MVPNRKLKIHRILIASFRINYSGSVSDKSIDMLLGWSVISHVPAGTLHIVIIVNMTYSKRSEISGMPIFNLN